MTAIVLQAGAAHLPLPDSSVDLIVTSPPYFQLRSYTDDGQHYDGQIGSEPSPAEYLEALWTCTREWMRVLKPSGSLFVNMGDKYAGGGGFYPDSPANNGGSGEYVASRKVRGTGRKSDRAFGFPVKSLMGLPWRYAIGCIDRLGLILRAEMIWDKPNGLPESVTDRVRRSHEQWFHFTLQPRYYAAVDEIREQFADDRPFRPAPTQAGVPNRGVNAGMTGRNLGTLGNALGKLPGSVWEIASEPLIVPAELDVDHFAAFPSEWPRRLILGWSPAGICTACGEGRRPTTDKAMADFAGYRATAAHRQQGTSTNRAGTMDRSGSPVFSQSVTITGYACGCDEMIGTPTGSRTAADPSLQTGRGGLNRPRGDGSGKRYISRRQQITDAHLLRTSAHRDRMAAEAGGAFAHYIRTDRAGARPIPADLRARWVDQGWLDDVDTTGLAQAPTRPAVILDPFGGTGTTAAVASALDRIGISVDLSHDYSRLAAWRTRDPELRAKIRAERRPVKQAEGQLGMFDDLGDPVPKLRGNQGSSVVGVPNCAQCGGHRARRGACQRCGAA